MQLLQFRHFSGQGSLEIGETGILFHDFLLNMKLFGRIHFFFVLDFKFLKFTFVVRLNNDFFDFFIVVFVVIVWCGGFGWCIFGTRIGCGRIVIVVSA